MGGCAKKSGVTGITKAKALKAPGAAVHGERLAENQAQKSKEDAITVSRFIWPILSQGECLRKQLPLLAAAERVILVL